MYLADHCHLLLVEVVLHLQLSPHEIDLPIVLILHYLPPVTPFHQLANQHTVVASTNPHLVSLIAPQILQTLHLRIEPITPLQFKQQLTIRYDSRFVDWVLILRVVRFDRSSPHLRHAWRLLASHSDRLWPRVGTS